MTVLDANPDPPERFRPDPKPVPVKKRRDVRPSLSEFRAAVMTSPCVLISPDCEGRLEAHHVIAAQKLRRIGREDLVADSRNGVPICERHHRRHTLGYASIPFAALPPEAVEFADELGLRWWLERFYPQADAAGQSGVQSDNAPPALQTNKEEPLSDAPHTHSSQHSSQAPVSQSPEHPQR